MFEISRCFVHFSNYWFATLERTKTKSRPVIIFGSDETLYNKTRKNLDLIMFSLFSTQAFHSMTSRKLTPWFSFRVLKAPGGGSSDIFGTADSASTPRSIKNHMGIFKLNPIVKQSNLISVSSASNIFAAPSPVRSAAATTNGKFQFWFAFQEVFCEKSLNFVESSEIMWFFSRNYFEPRPQNRVVQL